MDVCDPPCCAGMLLVFWLFEIPQLSGERLAALAALLGLFALASLPLTYFVHFLFQVRLAQLYRKRRNSCDTRLGYELVGRVTRISPC